MRRRRRGTGTATPKVISIRKKAAQALLEIDLRKTFVKNSNIKSNNPDYWRPAKSSAVAGEKGRHLRGKPEVPKNRIRVYTMLQMPNSGNQVFEVAIYNKEVRSLVKENLSHNYFDDYWADVQIRDIIAKDETEARRLIAERFPPDDGFVIETVEQTQV